MSDEDLSTMEFSASRGGVNRQVLPSSLASGRTGRARQVFTDRPDFLRRTDGQNDASEEAGPATIASRYDPVFDTDSESSNSRRSSQSGSDSADPTSSKREISCQSDIPEIVLSEPGSSGRDEHGQSTSSNLESRNLLLESGWSNGGFVHSSIVQAKDQGSNFVPGSCFHNVTGLLEVPTRR